MLKAVYYLEQFNDDYDDVQVGVRPDGDLELGPRSVEEKALLTQDMAADLWPLLKHFAETGTLPVPGNEVKPC